MYSAHDICTASPSAKPSKGGDWRPDCSVFSSGFSRAQGRANVRADFYRVQEDDQDESRIDYPDFVHASGDRDCSHRDSPAYVHPGASYAGNHDAVDCSAATATTATAAR